MRQLTVFLLVFAVQINSKAQEYPERMYPDTAFAPFLYGVASGDPLTDRLIIWTKITEENKETSQVYWEVSLDTSFSKLENSGSLVANALHDYCVKEDVTGLKPGTEYFYRFKNAAGKTSPIGRARTLPEGDVRQFKLAVVSCSSIWAGFFNAYRIIAHRSDIDFLVHLGDYVYDYPDERQLKRMPAEPVTDCAGLKDWRERHSYYLLDPDLREARQNKTWIAVWDNHDTDVEAPGKTEEAIQAFYEYLPIRMHDASHPEKIYRQFQFGKLADLNMIDMQLFRGKEIFAEGKKSVLGNEQDAWLKQKLSNSYATWQLIGNQEMMTDWLSSKTVYKLTKRGNGKVFDTGNWNGFPEDRQRLFNLIAEKKLNTVVLTGDVHMSFVMNITGYPKDKEQYKKRTGTGAIGVEIAGPSVSRVNMKEAGVPGGFIPLVQNISRGLNPHHRWCQFSKHGYFTINVEPDKCIAEFWYVLINKVTEEQKFGRGYTVYKDVRHWDKTFNKSKKHSTYP